MTLTAAELAYLDQGAACARTILSDAGVDPADPAVAHAIAVVCSTLAHLNVRLYNEGADVERILTAYGVTVASFALLLPGADAGVHTSADPTASQETP